MDREAPPQAGGSTPVERIYFTWNDALSRNDAETLLGLYAEDAVLESPLIPYLLGTESGVLHGHNELRPLFANSPSASPRSANITAAAI